MATFPLQSTFLRQYFDISCTSYNGSYKKAWCEACKEAHIKAVLAKDREEVERGDRDKVRSLEDVKAVALLFIPAISSRPDRLASHVKSCENMGSKEFRDELLERRRAEKAADAKRRSRSALSEITNIPGVYSNPAPAPFAVPYQFQPALPPLPVYPGAQTVSQSSLAFGHPQLSLPPLGGTPPGSALSRRSQSLSAPMPPDLQREFSGDLARFFATCNVAWNVVSHPETHAFFRKWVPDAQLPSRTSMSGPLLTAEAKRATAAVRSTVEGKLAMAQWDGWKNKARRSVITCVMNVRNKSFLVRSHDTFGKPKTGNYLWELAQGDISFLRGNFGVDLVGICTDDGPDGKRMRRLAKTAMPWLVITVCWAHQNQLIIGDLIRNNPVLKALLNRALDVIKWFVGHSAALAHLHEEQVVYLTATVAITLLLPVVTRWGAHYFSIARLLRLREAIQHANLRHSEAWKAIQTRRDPDAETSRMPSTEDVIKTIMDENFWKELARAKEHMEPLAISSHILQADDTHPDKTGLTLGRIHWAYDAPHVDPDIKQCVHSSLEKRWARADQEVFILAIALNPYIRDTCFNDANLPRPVIAESFIRTYTRIMRPDASFDRLELWAAVLRYLAGTGRLTHSRMGLDYFKQLADKEGKDVDLVQVWETMTCQHPATPSDCADNALVSFAIRIHSVITNSGGCERAFSGFGVTQSRIRNRLAVQSTHNINVVRMAVEAEHAANGRIPHRQKRRLGPRTQPGQTRTTGDPDNSPEAPAEDADELSTAAEEMLREDDPEADPASIDALEEVLCTGDGAEDDDSGEDPAPGFPDAITSSFTKIPLRKLFAYPSHGLADGSPLSFYWKAGIRDLEGEQEVLEAAARL